MTNNKKNIILFMIFGAIYCIIEILYRGYTHPSMFIVGGLCGVLIGLLNEVFPKMNMRIQCLLSTIIILTIEFLSGCILNILLDLHIWDYSNLPFNIMGQICLPFAIAWIVLSFFCIKLDDYLRRKIFNEIS